MRLPPPPGARILEPQGPQMVLLFEVVEPSGDGALTEELSHWGQAHFLFTLCLTLGLKM